MNLGAEFALMMAVLFLMIILLHIEQHLGTIAKKLSTWEVSMTDDPQHTKTENPPPERNNDEDKTADKTFGHVPEKPEQKTGE